MSGPWLDVTEALLSPETADRFTVNRRTETLNGYGEVETSTVAYPNVVGVVTAASPNDLQRLDDDQRMGRNMTVVTKFKLRGPTKAGDGTEFQPDNVVWFGDTYVVKHVDVYSRFGPGFVQAVMGSVDSVDAPA